MNVTPRYLGRGSWLSRRDPRVLILAIVLFVFATVQVWDARLAVVLFAIALLYYRSARIPWRAVRFNWLYVLIFIGFIVTTNTIITGGQLRGTTGDTLHVYFNLPLFGTPVSAESVSYAVTQLLRFLSMAAIGFPVAFAVAPGDIGVAFARLRIPERFAYAVDLTFRFIPSLAADVRTTIDAQRIRGYDYEKAGRGPIGRVRRTVPILVPVAINAIVGAEDTIDAMDLRAFGTHRRTWLRALVFDRTDRLVLVGFITLFVVVTVLAFNGASRLYVLPFLIP
ncbi:MAG TPA: energy-coupling factor transporter transmembrane component T [Candidatus Limnocylindrales bacterium]|nr:energy-coupling factor transporter transmembrane component T [Candidatus Limnocylindrales bacterium]